MNATTATLYSVQLFDPRFPASEGYCGCYAARVDPADLERVQAELVAANATTTLDEHGQPIRCFWTDPDEAEEAAERAEQQFPGIVADVDAVRA